MGNWGLGNFSPLAGGGRLEEQDEARKETETGDLLRIMACGWLNGSIPCGDVSVDADTTPAARPDFCDSVRSFRLLRVAVSLHVYQNRVAEYY